MPYCPKCKCEYREGFTHCHDCGGVLLPGSMPSDPEPACELPAAMEHPRLLAEISDQTELEMIKAMLTQQKIPFLARDVSAGSYLRAYMGFNVYGQRLYVDESRYEQASGLFEAYFGQKSDVQEEENLFDGDEEEEVAGELLAERQKEDSFSIRRRMMRVYLWIFVLIPGIAGLLYGIYNLIQYYMR